MNRKPMKDYILPYNNYDLLSECLEDITTESTVNQFFYLTSLLTDSECFFGTAESVTFISG